MTRRTHLLLGGVLEFVDLGASAGNELVNVRSLFGGDRSRGHRVSRRAVGCRAHGFHYSVLVAHCSGTNTSVGSVGRAVKVPRSGTLDTAWRRRLGS